MKCFQVQQKHQLEKQAQLRLQGKLEQVNNQRSFRDMSLFIKLLRLELKICAKDEWNVTNVCTSLQKAHTQIFEYIESEDYEEAPVEQWKGNVSANLKGLWFFNQDMLLQNLLYVTGLFYQVRRRELKFRKQKCLDIAMGYYFKSFASPLISHIEQKLMKKAIKKMTHLPLHQNVDRMVLPLILSKYYVKQRTVMVIMELCNEDPTTHELLLNFVKTQIFEKLLDQDNFGLITMRSGIQPFMAITLDKKGLNTKMKRKQLAELNFTSRMDIKPSKELEEAIQTSFEVIEEKTMGGRKREKSQGYQDQVKWIVAIVGPQHQSLNVINYYLDTHSEILLNTNLLLIGSNIADPDQCRAYRQLAERTPEGRFFNINFEPDFTIFLAEEEMAFDDTQTMTYIEAFPRIEALMSLYDSKREPFISEHIDFN
ncbi:hypothetical protein FGO68_gene8622 [Halteria grandinella]|uniref:Uncharacterized protein n=1 Tax=Halteria grandinella TaxID=5974 RepID=A0A8J8SW86_HALGN|nr:hypothetical protein FGO68_gene8622 [Halteria grandinella]